MRRSRPSYPSALIDRLMSDRPAHVLDVGCGTGKAARLMAARGCDVLGVEPDGQMAAVAQAHGIRVEVATFEAWDPAGRRFDLVMSAQAWHWIDPAVGPKKAASLLSAGGSLALFGNRGQLDPAVQAAMREVLRPACAHHGKGFSTRSRRSHRGDRPVRASRAPQV